MVRVSSSYWLFAVGRDERGYLTLLVDEALVRVLTVDGRGCKGVKS